jgi:dienelactone hydrolase
MTLVLFVLAAALQATFPPAPACAPAFAFTGTLCAPATSGKHPAILLLGGSDGGDPLATTAAAFGHRGYVAASIAYFAAPGVPATMQDIPVETVGDALAALKRRADVDSRRIGIMGISTGGEFALLAASTYPDIRAVVAVVPSPFAWQGIAQSASTPPESSWSVAGKPVPYVPYSPAIGQAHEIAVRTHAPMNLRPGYDVSMKNTGAINRAFFHLDRINGPVFFLSAGDDHLWDSVRQVNMGLAFLKKMHHRFADRATEYPLAGHLFLAATADRPLVTVPFPGGLNLLLGGTPKANVAAAADAWPRIMTFLQTELAPR